MNEAQTPDEIGMIDGVPQRKLGGGFYTQAEVDAVLQFNPPWIVRNLIARLRSAPAFRDAMRKAGGLG